MGNTVLTSDKITLKALQILHAKLNFIGSINRSYDDQFAQTGGKIGEALRIRLPIQVEGRTGATLNVQDTTEQSVTLTQATQRGVDMNFSSRELTMSIDDFSERYLAPAMSKLASDVEADVISMVLDVYNSTATPGGGADTLRDYLDAKTMLNQYLAPRDDSRMALIDSATSAGLTDTFKGFYQDQSAIAKQYREGVITQVAGFTFAENDLLPVLTCGSRSGSITINGAAPTGSTVALKSLGGATQTVKKGDVFTIAGYYAVHPETKQPYAHLQQFVATEDKTASGSAIASLAISPAIVTSGAYQNVSGTPGTDAVVTFLGTASTAYGQNICYQKDAFAFVSADLEMPEGVHFAARKVMDGISMRIVRQYDINNDQIPCRFDVFYGYKTIRPQLACRVWK